MVVVCWNKLEKKKNAKNSKWQTFCSILIGWFWCIARTFTNNVRVPADNTRPVTACIPASVAQVDASEERQTLVNHDAFLMMWPQFYPVRVTHHLRAAWDSFSNQRTIFVVDNAQNTRNSQLTLQRTGTKEQQQWKVWLWMKAFDTLGWVTAKTSRPKNFCITIFSICSLPEHVDGQRRKYPMEIHGMHLLQLCRTWGQSVSGPF